MKKFITYALCLVMAMTLFTACGGTSGYGDVALSYYDTFSTEGKDFNKKLFYRNELETYAADPSVIYVTEGEEAGWFYMYATSDQIGASGYQAWRSKNLNDWECTGVAFRPDGDSWGLTSLWAPEVIYDQADQTYYLFYNAINTAGVKVGDKTYKTQSISMAYSKHPAGPFIPWTGTVEAGKYADGTDYEAYEITNKTPLVDFTRIPYGNPLRDGVIKVIDASPFIDTDGSRYLYFCHDLGGGGTTKYGTSEIWGMKMIDWHTPDYSTVTKLTVNGKTKVENGSDIREGIVNEAPFMVKEDGKYYLTFSVYSYPDKLYQVRQAIAESPLGAFEKVSVADGGTVVAAETDSDFMSGTGHHSFVTAGDETFIVYHAHVNRTTGGGQRAIAFDRVSFLEYNGRKILQTNGPTYSLQALPAVYSGYKNIAAQATVEATNGAEGTKTAYLTDGLVKTRGDTEAVQEYVAGKEKTTITLSFSDYVTARAIMIYNSYNYDNAFYRIDRVEFTFKDGEDTGTAYIDNLAFDWDRLAKGKIMNPGGAAIAEFDDLMTNKITITLTCPTGAENVAVSEIVVLGK